MGISGFETDIFVSYHHGDNESLLDGDGWVSDFHHRLRVRLRQVTGIEPVIWRDQRLGAADVFSSEIGPASPKRPFCSPSYRPATCASWCDRELEEFQRAAGGLQTGNTLRVIKVVKTPVDGDRHREFLPSALGAEFFARDKETGYFREFKPASDEYDHALDRLAQEIKRLLAGLEKTSGNSTIYLADTTQDLRDFRTRLSQEFADRGHVVVPDSALATDADSASLAARISADLEPALLSVHVFGSRYGGIPDGGEQSVPELQYGLARAAGKPLVVWIVPGADAPAARQAEFLQEVMRAVDTRQELLNRKTIEDVKDVVLERIADLQKQAAAAAPAPAGERPQVYLVCDREDNPAVAALSGNAGVQSEELKRYLDSQGFVVWLPMSDETDATRLREDHKQTLQVCDAVVVYWGKASHGWFREKLRELVQAKGWGARRTCTKALYIAAPESPERKAYQRHEEFVFMQFGGFVPDPLSPFVERVSSCRGGADA